MELLQLKYFYESAKSESFAKTAEKYMVPTSSVSASVKRLETELGTKLFDRSCNRITLNDSGRKFQKSLCTIFDELERAVDNVSTAPTDEREIKMLVRATRSRITDCIIEYNQKHPDITFKTVFDFSDTDYEKYDIIIDEKTDAYPEYENFELYSERIHIRASAKNPLCNKKLSLRQLCNHSFISWGEQSNMHNILINACAKAGFTPKVSVHSNDIECIEKLIASDIGIGLGLGMMPRAGTQFLDVTDFDERYTIYSYYKKQACYGNVEHFLNFLKSNNI